MAAFVPYSSCVHSSKGQGRECGLWSLALGVWWQRLPSGPYSHFSLLPAPGGKILPGGAHSLCSYEEEGGPRASLSWCSPHRNSGGGTPALCCVCGSVCFSPVATFVCLPLHSCKPLLGSVDVTTFWKKVEWQEMWSWGFFVRLG